jgi:hypothetical protein
MPEKWHPAATDQLLAFTCCWPELEEPAPHPQLTPEGGQPPAWPLALLPLGLYALWWLATPSRGSRAVRAGNAGRVGGAASPAGIATMTAMAPANAETFQQ